MPGFYDIIIIGGGVIGCSLGYHLKKIDPNLTIFSPTRLFDHKPIPESELV